MTRAPALTRPLLRALAIATALAHPATLPGAETAAIRAPLPLPGPNTYWPGDFERTLFGGCFSSATNVTTGQAPGRPAGSSRGWQVGAGYQHLELLTDGTGAFEVAFLAQATTPVQIVVKVVHRDAATGKSGTTDIALDLPPDGAWHRHVVPFEVTAPYPGPRRGEVLLTCYNGTGSPAWIDDLEVRRTGPDPRPPTIIPGSPLDRPANGSFEDGAAGWTTGPGDGRIPLPAAAIEPVAAPGHGSALVLGGPAPASLSATQSFDSRSLAGRRVRLSADAAFLSVATDSVSWSGLLFELLDGTGSSARPIEPSVRPFWYVLGLAERTGSFRTVSAEFSIPPDSTSLTVLVQLQRGAAASRAAVDNLRLELLPQ